MPEVQFDVEDIATFWLAVVQPDGAACTGLHWPNCVNCIDHDDLPMIAGAEIGGVFADIDTLRYSWSILVDNTYGTFQRGGIHQGRSHWDTAAWPNCRKCIKAGKAVVAGLRLLEDD